MLKLFLLLFLSILSLSASTLEIYYNDTKFENFPLSYLKDVNNSYSVNTLQEAPFKLIKNRHAFSGKTGSIWYKLTLQNRTTLKKKFFLHNDLAYFSKEIFIYELSNNRLLTQDRYKILAPKETNKLTGYTLVYPITIEPLQSKTIILKNTPQVSNLFEVSLYDIKSSVQRLMTQSFYSIIIISILLTLSMYNATLYLFNRRKEFLLYSLYMLVPTVGLTYMYGILYEFFHFYGEFTYWFNLSAILMPAVLVFFLKEVLQTKKMKKSIQYSLNSILFLIALNVLSAFFVNLTFAVEIFKIIFLYTALVLVNLIIYLYKIKHPLAKIFSFAYGSYLLGIIIAILAMSNIITMNFFTLHASGIGLISEGLLFSYLMHNNIKTLEEKIQLQKNTIIQKNKKAQTGEMISAITHQWKQPLARISAVTSLLSFNIENKNEIDKEDLHKKVILIEDNVQFLSHTIGDFRDFFSAKKTLESCNITLIIQNAVKIIKEDSISSDVSIKVDLSIKEEIMSIKNELLHILINILQNAKDAFKKSNEEIKIIKIIAYNKKEKLYIDIIDNAGGIQEGNLPLIFDENYTTKSSKEGNGLGLYISKVIMQEHLKGEIYASNISGGTMFRIVL